MSDTERGAGEQGAEAEGVGGPEVVETSEGEWLERPPPDHQPQFRCMVRRRGSVVKRVVSDGTSRR
ncbi:MAG: hypothetical protein ACODAJ_01155 [Planctomycetota bacterium]